MHPMCDPMLWQNASQATNFIKVVAAKSQMEQELHKWNCVHLELFSGWPFCFDAMLVKFSTAPETEETRIVAVSTLQTKKESWHH
jgi:hypothetical protein